MHLALAGFFIDGAVKDCHAIGDVVRLQMRLQPAAGIREGLNGDNFCVGGLARGINGEYSDVRTDIHYGEVRDIHRIVTTHKHQPKDNHIDWFRKGKTFTAPQGQMVGKVQGGGRKARYASVTVSHWLVSR